MAYIVSKWHCEMLLVILYTACSLSPNWHAAVCGCTYTAKQLNTFYPVPAAARNVLRCVYQSVFILVAAATESQEACQQKLEMDQRCLGMPQLAAPRCTDLLCTGSHGFTSEPDKMAFLSGALPHVLSIVQAQNPENAVSPGACCFVPTFSFQQKALQCHFQLTFNTVALEI